MLTHLPILFFFLFPVHKERITEMFYVSAYPNPNQGVFHVQVGGATKEMNIRLYNMTGDISLEYKMTNLPSSTTFTIGRSDLNPGIYKLILLCSDGEQMIKEIIVER